MVIDICKECKKEERIHAKGKCLRCYERLRRRKLLNDPKFIERQKNWSKNNREKRREMNREDYKKNREKRIITNIDSHRYRNKKKECEKCKSKENLVMHHITYKRVNSKIIVLCRKCHGLVHRK